MPVGHLSSPRRKRPNRYITGVSALLCDPDLRRAQHPVLDRIPDLLAVDDGAGLLARHRRLVQRLVAVRVEHVARGVEWLDVVLEERLQEHAVRQLHALVQLL